ncbi:phosphatase PAP2 family protein [Sanguibacter sp. HDW7]|nr:phosphatase PAP2 family protein [Sanguibacter sp. HDW7]
MTSARLVPRVVALVTFAAFAVAFGQTVRIFLGTAAGQRFDELALAGSEHGSSTLWHVAGPVLDVVSVAFIAVAVVVVLVIAALRRAWGLGLQVAVLVAGANLTTQVLKHDVLERADLGVLTQRPGNSLPSGHTTVAASVAIALLLVVPRRARPYVALLGAAWTAATGVSTLVGQWHRPSDVLAALLVVGAWTGLVVAFTPRSAVDRTSGGAISTTAGAVVLGLGALVGGGFAVLTLGAGITVPGLEADDVVAYAGSVAAVVGLTCVLFLVALQLRQEAARRPR